MSKWKNEREKEWARQRKSKTENDERLKEKQREWKKNDRDREQRDREWEKKTEKEISRFTRSLCVFIYLNGWWQIYLSQECDMDGRFGSKKGYIQITVTQLQYEA